MNNLLDKEFKVMVTKILTRLEKKVDELSDNFNKEMENMRKSKSELKNTTTEMKKIHEGLNSKNRECRRTDQQSGRQGNGKHSS